MKPRTRICHTDIPTREASDDLTSFRQQAAETCGADYSKGDLFDVRRQIESRGGAGAQLDRIVRRDRGGK